MFDDIDGAETLHCPYCGREQIMHEGDEISAFCCMTECEHCGNRFWYSVDSPSGRDGGGAAPCG